MTTLTPQQQQYFNQLYQSIYGSQPPPAPGGPNSWINDAAPDGSLPYPGSPSLTGAPPKPSPAQQAAGAAGQIGGTAAGGAAGQALMAPATPAIVNGGTAGTGASGAAGTTAAAMPAGTGAGTVGTGIAESGTGWFGATGASPWLAGAGYAAGAATGLAQAQGVNDILHDKKPSWLEQGALSLIDGGGFSALARPFLGGGKGKDQRRRDSFRQILKDNGFITDDNKIELPGGTFDIGKDGGDGTGKYNVDFTDPAVGGIVGAIQPLVAFMAHGDKKLANDFTGYFVNAAKVGGDPMENVMALYKKTGLNHDQIYGQIHLMAQEGPNGEKPLLDPATADAYKNGLDQLFGVGAYAGKGSAFGTPPADGSAPQPPFASGGPAGQGYPATVYGSQPKQPDKPQGAAQAASNTYSGPTNNPQFGGSGKFDILVKPNFSSGNGGGFLVPRPGQITVYDSAGNVIDTGSTKSPGAEGYKVPSSVIHNGQAAYFEYEGQRYNINRPGQRQEYYSGQSDPFKRAQTQNAAGSQPPPSGVQNKVPPKMSPFMASPNYRPAAPGLTAASAKADQRLSPGIYANGKGGTYRK